MNGPHQFSSEDDRFQSASSKPPSRLGISVEGLLSDIRHGLRFLARQPLLAACVVVLLALGADQPRVLRLVFGYSMRLLGIGAGVSLVVILVSGKLIESLLYAVNAADPIVLMGSTAFVLLIGLLGAFIPALRSTRVDPVAALRKKN